MYVTDDQVRRFRDDGYLFLSGCFTPAEVEEMQAEIPAIFAKDTPARVLEKATGEVRSVYGSHRSNELFARIVRDPRVLEPARRILESEVYVHQFKINAKLAFVGEVWEWHQDYIFWQKEDGMPTPRVLNTVVFLDEVNEFNGPLLFIPGSHKSGVLDGGKRKCQVDDAPSWAGDVAADLSYTLSKEMISGMVRERGIVSPKGPGGSVLFFDANVAHGSGPNMSPFDRKLMLITYNSVLNVPSPRETPRPEFLCSRDFTPVRPLVAVPA
jgi:ectoine hydroxylase